MDIATVRYCGLSPTRNTGHTARPLLSSISTFSSQTLSETHSHCCLIKPSQWLLFIFLFAAFATSSSHSRFWLRTLSTARVSFLITGATIGAEFIITSRNKSNGELANYKIEKSAGIVGKGKVQVMELDMNRYSSGVLFVDELKKSRESRGRLDCIILNAGGVNPTFVESPEGW
jgi:hypothetical protein